MTTKSEAFLNELRTRLDGLDEGAVTVESPLPFVARPVPGSPVFMATGLADYSVQSWAEMAFPTKRVRVVPAAQAAPRNQRGEIVVSVHLER
jgi:hypothetical protein